MGENEDKKKDGTFFKMKKNLAGKAATSGFGKAVMKKVMDDNTNNLMNAIKKVVAKRYDKKKAEEMQNNIIKILLKAQFQIEKKHIDPKVFLPANRPLRSAFALLVVLNGSDDRQSENRKADFVKAENYFREVGKIADTHLGPHLTQKNKEKLTYTVDFLGSASFLQAVWDDPSYKHDRDELCKVIAIYS
eukprot:TRINITY_DN16804_c0_g1_i1.p1 TRINITY_DN16804_c0_g1~~TRINITY_DN16804_c0_g1_i1.p1  ORF type:complete len:190 (+),score=49.05 TRINITY_DN16804_c0_g1_i1:98-667(+)